MGPTDEAMPGQAMQDQAKVVPLGLAHLSTAHSVLVGARYLGQSGADVILGDGLQEISVRGGPGLSPTQSADGPPRPEPQPGDWVTAELVRSSLDEPFCCVALWLQTPCRRHFSPLFAARAEGAVPQQDRETAAIVARSRILGAVRSYFEEQGFLETPTPTFGVSPGLDAHVHSLSAVKVGAREEYLMTSPEFFMKRILARGLPRIYQIARAFRAEELGALHEPEFTLVEWYRTFSSRDDVFSDIEELVHRAALALRPGQSPWLFAPAHWGAQRISLARPFLRLTVREAFQRYAGVADVVALSEQDPAGYFQLLVDRVEPGLAALGVPVFLTNYPRHQAGLARLSAEDPSTAERFELSFLGVELCNGYLELTDPVEQRRRFVQELARRRAENEPSYPIDEKFLAALELGIPPTAGVALGLDRLILLAGGFAEIRETLAFCSQDH